MNDVQILKVWDQWGQVDWQGAWSQNSDLWTPQMRQQCDYFPHDDSSDGIFWISLREFLQLFDSLDVCRVASWDQIHIKGSFLRQHDIPSEWDLYGNVINTDKFEYCYSSRYFFGLDVRARSHVIIGLHQDDCRVLGTLDQAAYIDTGVALLKTEERGTSLIEFKDFQVAKDTEIEAILDPGTYIIVPRTTGCRFPRPVAKKVPMPFKEELMVEDSLGNRALTPKMEMMCEQIFNHFDSTDQHFLDFEEFKTFLIAAKFGLLTDLESFENYKVMILDHFNSVEKGLTLHGFKEFYLKMIENSYRDTIETLKHLGYNGNFVNERAKGYTLSVNSKPLEGKERVQVLIRDSKGTDIDQTATQLILAQHGKAVVRASSYTVVVQHSPLNNSWSYGIANHLKTGEAISGTLTFTGSENLVMSSGKEVVTKTI